MFQFISLSLKKGIEKVANNPQLFYTIFIAIVITISFIFMAERFIGIAETAEKRLINVRIGSLQDAFVSFAGEKIHDPEYLNQKIKEILHTNETIRSFNIVVKKLVNDPLIGTTTAYVIIASHDPEKVGTSNDQDAFLYSLSSGNPASSITIPIQHNGERLFETARAMTDSMGNTIGVVFTTQTLSMADQAISHSIMSGRILLFVIIALILILFLRHSKIVDYVALYKKLKEIDQLKDDFISMASHELRTPLTVIRGYAEFINTAPELSAGTREYVSKIDVSTKQLDSLVSDILDVSQIEQGRMSFTLTKVSPREVVQEVVTSFVLPAKEKGLSVVFDTSRVDTTQYIRVDANRLKQNLINLIGNAIKYTQHGEIIVRQYTEKERLYLRISDTGIGMTEEERAGLFGKFYRVKNDETKDIRGTGLGLWITARMIQEMGGNISVESIKGVGSHFIISFPLQA
ncbi:HAMP domain-containing histidine kinase [Candidatus Kaiserbacteria bacterium]|nr:HAMP domain-containing histidine kinase [Candidatus Kaiserbacteria bacterium]